MGTPNKYKPEFAEQSAKLARLGATDHEIAEFFGVHDETIRRWKHDHPEFAASLKAGKDEADTRVERALYQRAVGYSFNAVKVMQHEGVPVVAGYVEHVPPDIKAAEYWLNNRRKGEWASKVAVEHSGKVGLEQLVAGDGEGA